MTDRSLVPGCTRIAVLRANGLGDLVFALPALAALRAAYPDAQITLIGRRLHAALLANRPSPVDRVVALPWDGDGVDPLESGDRDVARAFFAGLARERFDVALQMHGGGGTSNPLVRLLDARVTAGAHGGDAASLDRQVPYARYHSEVLRWLEVAALVGAEPQGVDALVPRFATTPADVDDARRALAAANAGVELALDEAACAVAPLVVLHVGAGDARRRWAAERFAALADVLADAGARIAVNGVAATEGRVVRDVLARMRTGARAVDVGALPLPALAGLLSRAALVVGNDSGPLHLAAAIGVRTVGIYWSGNAITAAATTTRDHARHVSWMSRCPACGRGAWERDCGHPHSLVADVPVDDVVASARALLAAAAAEAPGRRPRVAVPVAAPVAGPVAAPVGGAVAGAPAPPARAPRGARGVGAAHALPARIAVLRALHLGDLLCAVPALRALRRAWPHAHVALVGLASAAPLAERFRHLVDELVALPGIPGIPESESSAQPLPGAPHEARAFLAKMRARRFDLVVQMHGTGARSNALALELGGRAAAGFHPADGAAPSPWFLPWRDDEHEVRRWLRLVAHVTASYGSDGACDGDDRLELPIDDADARALAARFPHGPRAGTFACVHPGSRRAQNRWPASSFAHVVAALAARDVTVVLTGAPNERDVTTEVRERVPEELRPRVIDTAALDLPLGALAALVARARLVVCNDTGISHVAAALRVPSVVVFCSADPRRWAPLDGERHRAIAREDATVERVVAEVSAVLQLPLHEGGDAHVA